MNSYKLIAIDLDGTFLNDNKEISRENREAIQMAMHAGKSVVISTGRGMQNVLPYVQELGISIPIVAVNGSEVWASPQELLKRQKMSVESLTYLHQLAIQYDTWWWAYSVEGVFQRDTWVHDLQSVQWLKFGFQTENLLALAEIKSHLQTVDAFEITNSHFDNIEVNPRGVTKASGVETICRMLGIHMSEVIAIGDSENDLSMIHAAGLGVAMGNAQVVVKAAADVTTVTNNEHGVAKIIHEYLLIR